MTAEKKYIGVLLIVLLMGFGIGYLVFYPKGDTGKDHDRMIIADEAVHQLKLQIIDDSLQFIKDSIIEANLDMKVDSLEAIGHNIPIKFVPIYASLDTMSIPAKIALLRKILGSNINYDSGIVKVNSNGLTSLDSLLIANEECNELLDNCGQVNEAYKSVVAADQITQADLKIELVHSKEATFQKGIAEDALKDEVKKKEGKITWVKIERDLLFGIVLVGAVAHLIFKSF